jgi:polysaccharide pyruvyl transferase WcaK-like protein
LALLMQTLELARHDDVRVLVRIWGHLPSVVEEQVKAAGGFLLDGRAPIGFFAQCFRSDMTMVGGQLVRANISIASLLFMAVGAACVRIAGGRVSARGLGVGEVTGIRKWLYRAFFAMADRVNVRDESSLVHAKALFGPDRVTLTADMAFLPSAIHERLQGSGSEGRTLVIAPCRDAQEQRTMESPCLKGLIEVATTSLPEAEIAFACHDPRPRMDGEASQRISELCGLADFTLSDGLVLDDLLRTYSDAALVITNRLHAGIFALIAQRPVIVVADQTGKVTSLAAMFDLPTLRLDQAYKPEDLEAMVGEALNFDQQKRRMSLEAAAKRAALNLLPARA